jgi:hypothetical protein
MGLGRKLIRRATPRTVRHVIHPVRTVKRKATPRSIRRVSRGINVVTNPVGAAESAIIFGRSRRHTAPMRTRRMRPARAPRVSSEVTPSGLGTCAPGVLTSHHNRATLFTFGSESFSPIQKQLPEPPIPVDHQPFTEKEWSRRKRETSFWRPAKRRQVKDEVAATGREQAEAEFARATETFHQRQAEVDEWWTALHRGDPKVLKSALEAAYADNPARVVVVQASATQALLCIVAPWPDVLPEKKSHVTPTGRDSERAWTKTEFNQTYASILGGNLLGTIRETWATAPTLSTLRIFCIRGFPDDALSEVLFDVEVSKSQLDWGNDATGDSILADLTQFGLHRVGRAHEVLAWPREQLRPDLATLVEDW